MKKQKMPSLLLLALVVSLQAFAVPALNSLKSAKATIYLDFNGHQVNSAYWNGGNSFYCAPAGMTDQQITEVFNRVAEDYRPFDINITTSEVAFLEAPLSNRIRIIITPTSSWTNGVGGIAYIGSFTWGDDTPAFVFCDRLGASNAKAIAECCAHESGHAVGLSHQSSYDGSCNLTAAYNEGAGAGESGWAPIMGNSYQRNMSGWTNGPTPYGCENKQDNLSIITTNNGFSYRADDYTGDIEANPFRIDLGGTATEGVIATSDDLDAFSFALPEQSILQLHVKPFSVDAGYAGANLDIKVSLYDAAKKLIGVFDPAAYLDVKLDTVLKAGVYIIVVDGTGNSNVDDYGSLGSYFITGTARAVAPIRSVTLSGVVNHHQHALKWDIIADAPVKSISIESSNDGLHFTPLPAVSQMHRQFTYTPAVTLPMYYRLKATSVYNQHVYSNIVQLHHPRATANKVKVSTFNHGNITLQAGATYQYMLADANGRGVGRGNGTPGQNTIDIEKLPAGIYVLQIWHANQRQTERILKL